MCRPRVAAARDGIKPAWLTVCDGSGQQGPCLLQEIEYSLKTGITIPEQQHRSSQERPDSFGTVKTHDYMQCEVQQRADYGAVVQLNMTYPILLLVPNFSQVSKRSKSSPNYERLAGIEHFIGLVQNFLGQTVDECSIGVGFVTARS